MNEFFLAFTSPLFTEKITAVFEVALIMESVAIILVFVPEITEAYFAELIAIILSFMFTEELKQEIKLPFLAKIAPT